MPRIVLCYPVESRHIAQIEAAAPDWEVIDAGQERIAAELLGADIFCGHPKVSVDWPAVVAAGRLKWIQSSAAGLDHLLVPSVVESDVVVTSASGVLADQVAEHALAMTLAWLRSLPRFQQAQHEREYIRRPTRDLHEKCVVIVGFGGVGMRIAEVFSAFRTHRIAVDLFPECREGLVEEVVHVDRLHDVLPQADVLILSAPLTPYSRGMIGAAELALLKPDCLFVNVGRGSLVVQSDLIAALQSSSLAGACLDVADPEPPEPDSPLWGMENVLLTPHVAGQSGRRIDQMTDFFCTNLRNYFSGAPLVNLVDKQLGFPRPVSTAEC